VARDGGALRPGNCGDCGAALDSARQTYCPDHSWERRQRSNLEADRRRRQADRDRRLQAKASATAPDGGVLLPPDTVRLLALQVEALREAVTVWLDSRDLLVTLNADGMDSPESVDALAWVNEADLDLTDAAATAAGRFVAAIDNLLPPEALGG